MSFGKKKKQTYYDSMANTAVENVSKPSVLEELVNKRTQKMLDWDNSTAPKDITTAPGMDAQMDVYRMANQRADADRVAMGGLNLADTNSAYSDQLKQQNKMAVRDITGQGMHEALNNLRGEAYGQANQSIGYDMNRKNAAAGFALQNQNNYYNRPKKKPWWQTILEIGVGAAKTAASGGAGGAGGFSGAGAGGGW